MSDAEVLTSRPRRLTKVCWCLALLLLAVFAVLGQALRGGPEGAARFQLGDQIAMTLLGLGVGGSALLLTRPRIVADATGIRFRNAEVAATTDAGCETCLLEGGGAQGRCLVRVPGCTCGGARRAAVSAPATLSPGGARGRTTGSAAIRSWPLKSPARAGAGAS